MITENKRWMTYTYFNHAPQASMTTTHLFSFAPKVDGKMVSIPFATITVAIDADNFTAKWSSSARTKINKASQEGLLVRYGDEYLEEVLELFMITARKKGLRGYTVNDISAFPNLCVSVVFQEKQLLCGHVWLVDEQEKRALLYVNATASASDAETSSLIGRAHYYLLAQDGIALHRLGVMTMDLMGYQPETNDPGLKGVYQWKAATHGKEETLYHHYPFWFYVLRKIRNILRQ